MKSFFEILAGTVMLCLLFILNVDARASGASFGMDAGTAYRYDSNVGVPEIDENSGESDSALLLDLSAEGSLELDEGLAVGAGYGFKRTAYRQFSEFDLDLHRLHVDTRVRFGRTDTRLAVERYLALVDQEDFLELWQFSPSVARLVSDRFYLRGAYARTKKNYTDEQGRNADIDAIRGDLYWLINGMQQYVSVTAMLDTENALEDQYDNLGQAYGISYGQRLAISGRELELKTRLNYELVDYDAGESPGAEARRDERWRASLSATLPLTDLLDVGAEAVYADNESNQESADYSEVLFSLRIGFSW